MLHHELPARMGVSKVDSPATNSAGADDCPSNSNVEISYVPPQEDLIEFNTSVAAAGIGSGIFPGGIIKSASPFRLLQDYASDGSLEDDDKHCLEDASPLKSPPSNAASATGLHGDIGSDSQTDTVLRTLASSEMGIGMLSESIVACSQSMPLNKDVLDDVHDFASGSGKSQSQKKDVKYTITLPKVNEYGRLVREGSSNSDTDELHYTGRRDKRQSWNRSQLPCDRRRSPRRRKEKQSRSRTCHRGESCRYMHDDSYKSEGPRCYRIKQQYVAIRHVSWTYDLYDEIAKTKRSNHEQDMPGTIFGVLKDGKGENVSVSLEYAMQSVISDQDDKFLVVGLTKSERSGGLITKVRETPYASTLPSNENCQKQVETVQPVDGFPSCPLADVGDPTSGGTSFHVASAVENFVIPQSQTNVSLPVLPSADHQQYMDGRWLFYSFQLVDEFLHRSYPLMHEEDHQPQHMDGSSTSGSSQVQTSTIFQNQLLVSEPQLNKISSVHSYPGTSAIIRSFSSQPLPPMDLTPPTIPAVDNLNHHSQLPLPLPSLSQGTSRLQNQNSHFVVPPNSSQSLPPPPSLPPRPPFVNCSTVNAVTAMQGVPSTQFHQNQLAPINDFTLQTFIRPYPLELPAHSQLGKFQHQLPTNVQLLLEKITSLSFQYRGLNPPNSYAKGNIPCQAVPSLRDSTTMMMQSYPNDNLPSGGIEQTYDGKMLSSVDLSVPQTMYVFAVYLSSN
ncbi:hypothetical protein Acr_26g0002660 [Actinidia rufa]|uniref:C3H1-type domain-containing protein n=1 Tax=Actinidia rufa TaxID=165716 RepID=A0A7J0H1P7_9ERIC|nr:hypothetical protein Acr_26g0002660 [Actinidia rufa]